MPWGDPYGSLVYGAAASGVLVWRVRAQLIFASQGDAQWGVENLAVRHGMAHHINSSRVNAEPPLNRWTQAGGVFVAEHDLAFPPDPDAAWAEDIARDTAATLVARFPFCVPPSTEDGPVSWVELHPCRHELEVGDDPEESERWEAPGFSEPSGTPAWRQPTGAHDAYPLGARVTHAGQTWESTVAANVWEPGVFGWAVV